MSLPHTHRPTQFICSMDAEHLLPQGWVNFDISPVLYVRENFILKFLLLDILRRKDPFPKSVKYGNIVKGFPEYKQKCKGVYCSHVLEHLTLDNFRKALKNTYNLLQSGGCFRLVVPDLECYAKKYLEDIACGDETASICFMEKSYLGLEKSRGHIREHLSYFYFSNVHFWMWDRLSLEKELKDAGFVNIMQSIIGCSSDKTFNEVEDPDRFVDAVCIEGYRP